MSTFEQDQNSTDALTKSATDFADLSQEERQQFIGRGGRIANYPAWENMSAEHKLEIGYSKTRGVKREK